MGRYEKTLAPLRAANVERFFKAPPPPLIGALLVNGDVFMPAGKVCVLGGQGGVGKTTLLLAIAVGTACGCQIAGAFTSGRIGPVVVIAGEEGPDEIHRTLYPLIRELNLSAEQMELLCKNLHVLPAAGKDIAMTRKDSGSDATSTGFVGELCEHLPPDVAMVIIDPISRVRGGDENSNADATKLIQEAEKIVSATGATVIFGAHTNKASARDDPSQHALRGGSAIVDGARWVAMLVRMSESERKKYQVLEKDCWRYVRLSLVKSNYTPISHTLWFKRSGAVLSRQALRDVKEKAHEGIDKAIISHVEKCLVDGEEYSIRRFATTFGGEDKKFKIGIKKLEQRLKEIVADGELVVRPPSIKQRNVQTVLDLPESSKRPPRSDAALMTRLADNDAQVSLSAISATDLAEF